MPPRVGLGLLTYERPEFAERALASIQEHLADQLDEVVAYDDCSRVGATHYDRLASAYPGVNFIRGTVNIGVAMAKNVLFNRLLDRDCDWLFLAEDDIEVLSPEAVSGYIEACERSGLQHLSFAHHGGLNKKPVRYMGSKEHGITVACWPHSVGAWSVYSAESLDKCGLMDDGFSPFRSCEHIEHTLRLAEAGYTAWPGYADAFHSEDWLQEIPGAIEQSVIRSQPGWEKRGEEAKAYWREAHPSTYRKVWPIGYGVKL